MYNDDENREELYGAGSDPVEPAGDPEPIEEQQPVYAEQPVYDEQPIEEPPVYDQQPRQEYPVSHTEWSEPRYTPAEPVREYYSPNAGVGYNYAQPQQPQPKKEKKSHPFLRAVALVLVCALVSGFVSYGVVTWVVSRNRNVTTQVVLGADSNRVAESGTALSAGDSVLTANTIYSEACNYQVVGVNTSVNTRNRFGQTSTNAVSGSGFVISSDGYILTNYHVISYAVTYGGDLTVMFEDGTTVKAEAIVGYSEDNDVAVIKIDPTGLTLNPVVLGDSDSISVGETVYAIGNPLGELTFSMTPGIVSALDRVITTQDDITGESKSINMFQISAAVNSGNSGGPVYNSRGEVIGIVTAKYSDSGIEGLGFAIPINDAVSIAQQLIEKGYVTGAKLGITCIEVEDIYATVALQSYGIPDGVYVNSVEEGSCAEKAGLKAGDIITGICGVEVSSIDELKMILRRHVGGEESTIDVYRISSLDEEAEVLSLSIVFDESETGSPAMDSDISDPQDGTARERSEDNSSSWGDVFGD